MKRNLILLISIILFWFGLRMIYHSILIIDHPKVSEVYMNNKDEKIDRVEMIHNIAKEGYIFAKMMANNNESLINAVISNNSKFWINEEIREGSDSKFDKLIQSIIRTNKLDIDYKGSIKLDNYELADKYLGIMNEVTDLLETIDFPEAVTGGLRRTTDQLRSVVERTRGDVTLSLDRKKLENQLENLKETLKNSWTKFLKNKNGLTDQ